MLLPMYVLGYYKIIVMYTYYSLVIRPKVLPDSSIIANTLASESDPTNLLERHDEF